MIVSLGTRLSSSSTCNGVTIQKKTYMGKRGLSLFSPSKVRIGVEGKSDCSLFLLRPFSFTNLEMRFLLRGPDYDTLSVTIVATVFHITSTV
jgi:hypothetical protein